MSRCSDRHWTIRRKVARATAAAIGAFAEAHASSMWTLNDVDPQAWLAFVLAKLPDHPAKKIDELLPWNWKPTQVAAQAKLAAAA